MILEDFQDSCEFENSFHSKNVELQGFNIGFSGVIRLQNL